MTSLLRRIAATFVEPTSAAESPPTLASRPTAPGQDAPTPAVVFIPPRLARVSVPPDALRAPNAPATQPDAAGAPRAPAPPDAVVLAADAAAVPLGAACAGELRARARSGAALLCVWQSTREAGDDVELPWDADDEGSRPSTPASATTSAARRLAGRLAAHGLETNARGRLAWLALVPDPAQAATQVHRCLALADAPLVLAVAGPRDAAFEPLIAEGRLVLAVLPPDADPALHELVTAALPGRGAIVGPLRAGPPRWAAMAGLGRLRSLATEDT